MVGLLHFGAELHVWVVLLVHIGMEQVAQLVQIKLYQVQTQNHVNHVMLKNRNIGMLLPKNASYAGEQIIGMVLNVLRVKEKITYGIIINV